MTNVGRARKRRAAFAAPAADPVILLHEYITRALDATARGAVRLSGLEYLGRARKGVFPKGETGAETGAGRPIGQPQGVICVIYTSHEHRRVYNRACPLDSRDYTSLS